jgi:diguanylate cyclase (GGDEF)-like protein/PAS domain S-box-containing protein
MGKKKGNDLQQNTLLESHEFTLSDFIDYLPDAAFMIDRSGNVVFWNHAMELMTGVSAADMIGKGNYEYALPFYEERRPILIDIVINPDQYIPDKYYLFKKNEDMVSGETIVPGLRGKRRYLWGNAMAVRNVSGEIIGGIETIRDITDIRFSEERLRTQEERYHWFFENIQDVYYEVAIDGTFLELSPSVENVFGWKREELIGTSVLQTYFDPKDRDSFIRDIKKTGKVYDYELLLKHRDGSPLNIALSSKHIPGNDLEPPRNIGSMRDITRRKKIEEALRISEERYRTLVENIPIAVIRTTPPPNSRCLMVNPAFLRMFGYASEDEALLIDPAERFFNPAERDLFTRRVIECEGLTGYEIRFRRRDGTPIWGAITAKAVYDKDSGKVAYFDFMIEDITARKKTEEEILRLAYYDSLTELPNRTLFLDRLQTAIARADREKNMVVLMMFDLDRFKDVNDKMGHPAGDQLLKAIAERLMRRLRKSDTIARLGGDEFMVIYTGVRDIRQVEILGDKLLHVFQEPFRLEKFSIRITSSVGVSVYQQDAADLNMMLRNVDIALYKAKDDGGNSVRRYVGGREDQNAVQ